MQSQIPIDTKFEKGVFGIYPGGVPVPLEDTIIKSSTNTTVLLQGQVTQPITQLRRIGYQIKQQQLAVEISEMQLRATEQSLVNELKRAYYAILQTEGAVRAAKQQVSHVAGKLPAHSHREACTNNRAAAGAGDLFDLRSRFETGEVGKSRDSTDSQQSLAGCVLQAAE